MKKTLVAIAALAAFGAQAQSSVSITGYMDRAYTSVDNNNNERDLKSFASSAGTTAIFFKGTEDLGGGLTAGFSLETNFNDIGGATQANNAGTAQRLGFNNGEGFLSMGLKDVGTLRVGAPNSFTNTAIASVGSPALSSGVGSVYSSTFSVADGMGTGASDTTGIVTLSESAANKTHAGVRSIRMPNTLQLSSAVISGFSAHYSFAPKNHLDAGSTASATFLTKDATDNTSVKSYRNTVGMSEYALRYTMGPVDAMYTSIKYTVGNNIQPIGASVAATAIATGLTSTQNFLGATYTVTPQIKLHAGLGDFKSSTNTYKGSSTQFGATYTMGKFDFMAQQAKVDDSSSANTDRKLTGMGVNYNFSKNTRAYFRNETAKFATNQAAFTVSGGSEQKRMAIGLSTRF